MSSELNSPTPLHFSSLMPKMLMFTLATSYSTTSNLPWFLVLTFQVPMQYFFLTASIPFRAISLGSPVAYWTPTNLGVGFIFQCRLFILFMGFSRQKNAEVLYHSLLQWATFCQNSPPWPIPLGLPYTARLVVSLSDTELQSMWSFWLVFYDCGLHPVCPLTDVDKRLVQASWWERLAVTVLVSWSGGQGCAQGHSL